MNISYKSIVIRDYCYSTNPDLSNSRFTINEIQAIRAYIADIRSAPSLADAPLSYDIINFENGEIQLHIQFGKIKIQCRIISSLENPRADQIKRILILDILKIGS